MSNKNQILLLVMLGTLIACFFFWNNRTGPLRQELANLEEIHEQERYQAEVRVRDGQHAQRQLNTLKAEVEANEARYDTLLATVPTRRDTGGLLDEVASLATGSGATLLELSPSEREQSFSDDINYLTAEVRVSGNYAQTIKFLTGVESLNRFADVSNVQISRRNDDWRDPTLNTALTLRIYLYRGAAR